jgi:hypothetical protein
MFVSEVFNKNAIFIVLLIILVQLTFLLSISSVLQRQNPLPPPPGMCRGWGNNWIFSSSSRSFGYGYEAARIRVKGIVSRDFGVCFLV